MRKLVTVVAALAIVLVAMPRANAADDASAGYESIRPSLVKVWAFDRSGRPSESGTGVVVDSDEHRSLVLTATHVVNGAAAIRIDVSRDVHDLSAHVERGGPRDLTLLAVDRGNLRAAHFAPRTRAVVEGNLVAVAGYVKHDELIGVAGQEPRILFPGTVAARPDGGKYLELENVHIEEGLSGGAVFDPGTGDVLGIVTARTTDQRGGFADSGALVVLPFLNANRIALAAPRIAASAAPRLAASAAPRIAANAALRSAANTPARITLSTPTGPSPTVAPSARVSLLAPQGDTEVSAAETRAALRQYAQSAQLTLPAMAPAPTPAPALAYEAQMAPVPLPPAAIVSWQAANAQPKRFIVTRAGCRIAVTIDVQTLQFVISHQALVTPHRRGEVLAITLQQRAGRAADCDSVSDTPATNAAYEPTAMSYDGHHVTMRFTYAGSRENVDQFPLDASLDATLDADPVTATLQFYDRDWSGALTLPLARTALESVSSTW